MSATANFNGRTFRPLSRTYQHNEIISGLILIYGELPLSRGTFRMESGANPSQPQTHQSQILD